MKRLQNNLSKNALLPKGSHILIAVSGGPDSMALLSALARLQSRYDWQLAVAHVNYGLRGTDSEKDCQLVERETKKLNIPFYLLKKKISGSASEERLRDIRYAFFDALVAKHGFSAIALAHHQDDQAETVLQRLIRGSGSLGLSGMRMRRGKYVRPFLPIPKQEILDYVKNHSIPYRLDTSNNELFYLRNKVRHLVLPLLETLNPKIKKILASTAETLQDELELLQNNSKKTLRSNKVFVSCTKWSALSRARQQQEVRTFFRQRNLALPTKNLVENLIKDLSGSLKKGKSRDYSRLRVTRKDDIIHIHFKELA